MFFNNCSQEININFNIMCTNISVIMECLDNNPCCTHGPTILFSKEIGGKKRKFFACAACRNRKDCNFFLWEEDVVKYKKKIWLEKLKHYTKTINHRKKFMRFNKIQNVSPNKRIYCHLCNELVISDNKDRHKEHQYLKCITDYQLSHPTELLLPLEDSKKEAQYLFSKNSINALINIFKNMDYENIICMGTPRLHEYILNENGKMASILLDFDKRFHNFFGPLQYCWYNLFNHHFFFKNGKQVFEDFLQSNRNTVLVLDPPFGGRIEPIVLTLNKINQRFKEMHCTNDDLPVFWIFPYFMEPQINNWLPNFTMLDLKIDYQNHVLFQNKKGKKKGSPIRVFTNVNPSFVKLPEDDYKYCKSCTKWVSMENNHCDYCNSCTSKNGTTYKHCFICQRCVKPTWQHCDTCKRCALVNHNCKLLIFSKECLSCKKNGHKKVDCPLLTENHIRKRKSDVKRKSKKRR